MSTNSNSSSSLFRVSLTDTNGNCLAGGPVLLRFTVFNDGAKEGSFCRYHTPFEGFRNNFLSVTAPDGATVEYHGIMAKRLPPGPDDYLQVAPNSALSIEIDLQEAFLITKEGPWQVQFLGNSGINGLPDSAITTIQVK